jgi:hypothetical protein
MDISKKIAASVQIVFSENENFTISFCFNRENAGQFYYGCAVIFQQFGFARGGKSIFLNQSNSANVLPPP